MNDNAEILSTICNALSTKGVVEASAVVQQHYPFIRQQPVATRSFSEKQAFKIFMRDGFVDRYSGERLVFPAALRILTYSMPDTFPFHRNWKMDKTHQAYWELFPTLDHIVPAACGGLDDESNLVTTSMLRNSAKANFSLKELDWSLHPAGDMRTWDGLVGWCLDFVQQNQQLASEAYIGRWCRVAQELHKKDV